MDAAVSGIHARIESFNRAAERIARQAPGGDLVRDRVRTIADQHAISANIKVIRAADEMTQSLLHVIA